MQGVNSDSSALEPVGQFFAVQNVRKFGLAVGIHRVVTLVPIEIIPVHAATLVGKTRYNYNSVKRRDSLRILESCKFTIYLG